MNGKGKKNDPRGSGPPNQQKQGRSQESQANAAGGEGKSGDKKRGKKERTVGLENRNSMVGPKPTPWSVKEKEKRPSRERESHFPVRKGGEKQKSSHLSGWKGS